jgi:hypothetical protein
MKRGITMKHMLVFAAAVLLLAAPPVLFAQQEVALRSENDAIRFCEEVMQHLQKKEYDAGFDLLYDISVPSMKEGVRDLRFNTEDQINQIQPSFGQIVGFRALKTENFADVLLKVTYLLMFEHHALRWEFLFYKPRQQWVLDNIYWDDTLTKLFAVE